MESKQTPSRIHVRLFGLTHTIITDEPAQVIHRAAERLEQRFTELRAQCAGEAESVLAMAALKGAVEEERLLGRLEALEALIDARGILAVLSHESPSCAQQ